jgi:hypothetical protein
MKKLRAHLEPHPDHRGLRRHRACHCPGQLLASFVMILGYAIIVVPTGIFSVELAQAAKESDARIQSFCPHCGESLS